MGKIKNLLRNLNYLSKNSLWDQREKDIVYLTNKILDDVQYEYDLIDGGTVKPKILDGEKSLDLILETRKSFVRTSDGEVKIMMGMDQPFQNYDRDLADGLRKILSEKKENLLVGINRNYYIPGYVRNYSDFYRRYAYDYRQYYKKILNPEITYIDATLTGYQFGKHKDLVNVKRYEKWRKAFENENIIIVSGVGVLEKLQYDIFELAKSMIYIYGPSKNAWTEHDRIMKEIQEQKVDNPIIVFILGMAGKVMAAELAEQGYTCWDVGHLAKYYDAFMKGMEGTEDNIRKFYAPD